MVLFRRSLIVVLVLIALALLFVGTFAVFTNVPCKTIDPFTNGKAEAFTPVIPDTRVQTVPSSLGSDAVELNGCWRKILNYIQTNPGKAMPLLNFAKANFFNASCSLRQPRIHFETMADQYQPIFT
jgi:hypothetical protein